jgi:hypothetical protein
MHSTPPHQVAVRIGWWYVGKYPVYTSIETVGRSTNLYEDVRASLRQILEGIMLSIDPSIGSNSSMPGWAVYRATVLTASGTLEIDPLGDRPQRLQELTHCLRKLIKEYSPDVLAYEDIPPRRYGGGGAAGHASLLMALGATLAVSGPDRYVRLAPRVWKRLVSGDYRKSDEADAIEMGRITCDLAQHISNTNPPRRFGSRKRPTPARRKGEGHVST